MRIGLALGLCLLAAPGANAQSVNPGAAAALQKDLRSWLVNVLHLAETTAASLVRVTAEADRYRFATDVTPPGETVERFVTLSARPIENGRWDIEGPRFPVAFEYRIPSVTGRPETRTRITVGSQNARATIDPTMATQSSGSIELRDYGGITENTGFRQEFRTDQAAMRFTLSPITGGRLDFDSESQYRGWRGTMRAAEGPDAMASLPSIKFSAGTVSGGVRVSGINRDGTAAFVASLMELMRAVSARPDMFAPPVTEPGPGPGRGAGRSAARAYPVPEEAHAFLTQCIAAIGDIFTSASTEFRIADLMVDVAGAGAFRATEVRTGMKSDAPLDRLRASIEMAITEPVIQGLPPDALPLVPTHIVIRPNMSGLDLKAVRALLTAANVPAPDEAKLTQGALALLGGDSRFGLDILDISIGPARFEGVGEVRFATPEEPVGRARIIATGIDEWMRSMNGNPMLAQAMPIVAIMRGMAKQEGTKSIWDIDATKARVLVNGIDVAQMGPRPPPRGQPKPAPSR